jgi:hypothetical protein
VNHCTDRLRNADEQRADCGGADCPACGCASTTTPNTSGYCSASCLCGSGEGICTTDTQCLPGLTCKPSSLKYDLSLATFNVCQPFHCFNRVQDSSLGETGADCGGECGSCACGTANGSALHCRVNCPCASGNGTCAFDDECAAGKICGSTKTGPRFGLGPATRACVVPHCDDGIINSGETAKDCGTVECGMCP